MLQTADFADEGTAKACLAALEHFLELLHEHAGYEDRTVFAAMRKFEPEMIDQLESEHGELGVRLDRVHQSIDRVKAAGSAQARIEAGDLLNRSVNDFIAFYLGHLSHEEATVLPATFKYFTDQELTGMRAEVQRTTSPARFAEWMRWMFPSINTNELVDMFRGLKAHAPRPFYEAMCQIANITLGELAWQNLQFKAGLLEQTVGH